MKSSAPQQSRDTRLTRADRTIPHKTWHARNAGSSIPSNRPTDDTQTTGDTRTIVKPPDEPSQRYVRRANTSGSGTSTSNYVTIQTLTIDFPGVPG
ncbi:hypothetical protein [Nocardia sp. NPDC051463]|uniref:hypothetical protein n=1 Tax=Nocardia sp. NPDC051463 TaxID=3154845 RepID=UPI00344BA63E